MTPMPVELLHQGSRFFNRLRSYYVRNEDASPPPISEQTAFLCAGLFTIFYVAPFYLSATLRTSSVTSRDAPAVIRARVRAVGLTCLACTVVTVYFLAVYGHATPQDVLRMIGVWPVDPIDTFKVLGLVMTLFSCSLYEEIIVDGAWRGWSLSAFKEGIWDNWTGYRNLLIAPITEELVFRALTIPLFLLAKTSATRIVFTTPLVFGLAHLHHLFEFLQIRTPQTRRLPPMMVFLQGILLSTFQFTYTSVFGFFTAFVFLRTGSLWAVIVAHSFCNRMGLPRVWGRVGQYEAQYLPLKSTTPNGAHGKGDDDCVDPGSPVKVGNSLMQDEYDESKGSVHAPESLGIGWTVVYYALVIAGAYSFYLLLFPLTESKMALATFEGARS